jgi:hypothetical protein
MSEIEWYLGADVVVIEHPGFFLRKALESLGISLDAVRQQVEEIIGQGQQTVQARLRHASVKTTLDTTATSGPTGTSRPAPRWVPSLPPGRNRHGTAVTSPHIGAGRDPFSG